MNASFQQLSPVVAVLERVAQKAMGFHPDLPGVTVTVAPAPASKQRGFTVLGYFSPEAWAAGKASCEGLEMGEDPLRIHEVLISGETLSHGADQVLSTMLHELVHAMNRNRDARDTSNRGRYHNKVFRAAAEEMLLEVADLGKPLGHSGTSLTPEARDRYAQELADLVEAIKVARVRKPDEEKEKKAQDPAKKRIKLVCENACTDISIQAGKVVDFLTTNMPVCPECKHALHPPEDFEDPDEREVPRVKVRVTVTARGVEHDEPQITHWTTPPPAGMTEAGDREADQDDPQ